MLKFSGSRVVAGFPSLKPLEIWLKNAPKVTFFKKKSPHRKKRCNFPCFCMFLLVAFYQYHAKLEFTDVYHHGFVHAILQDTVETYVLFARTLETIVNISILRCHHVHKTS